jgi:hypothetical protein
MKSLYLNKRSGDLFAIETDGHGNVVSTSGPLLFKDLDPNKLDYDNYWDNDVKVHLKDFVLLSKAEYQEFALYLFHRYDEFIFGNIGFGEFDLRGQDGAKAHDRIGDPRTKATP